MSKLELTCTMCGKTFTRYPSQVKKTVFCSRVCAVRFSSKTQNPEGYKYRDFSKNAARFAAMNRELNATRMTPEVKSKLREARLGTGRGKTYTKTYGRHTHRLVMEQMLGRALLPTEIVHHKDGNKRNNAPENLQLFSSQKAHAAWHAQQRKEVMPNAV